MIEFYVHFERKLVGDKSGSLKEPKAFAFALDNFRMLADEIDVKPLDYFFYPPLEEEEPFEIEIAGEKLKIPPPDPSSFYTQSKWVPASLGLKTVSALLAELKRRKNKHFEKVVVSDLKVIEKQLKLAEKQKVGFRFNVM